MQRWLAGLAVIAAVALAACGVSDDAEGALFGDMEENGNDGPSRGSGGSGAVPETGAPAEDWRSGENYAAAQENDFVDPAEDNLCTFGIDVDTASYTLMRRDVRAGMLPVSAGVRPEEYLNYFDYLYEPPAEDAEEAFAIHLDGAPSPFGEGLHLLRIGIKGKELPAPTRGRANLIFLVDVSGSMASDDKLGLVKRSLEMLVDELRPDDTIGLVTYAGDAGVALRPTPVAEREAILAAIAGLDAGGSTYGEAGIRMAYDLASDAFSPGGINRVILATDGDMNVGLTGDALVALIEEFRGRGIYLTTLGFGRGNYNDALMEQLADHGNGNYAYVDSLAEAERVFRREILGTLIVIAKDVKIQVEIDPAAVVRYRLLGYENRAIADEDFRDPEVDTGDIGSGHDVTALIELELKEGARAAGAPVATVFVRHKDPEGSIDREVAHAVHAAAFAETIEEAPESLRFAAAVAEYAEILRRSRHSEGARFSEVIDLAAGATAGGAPARLEFIELAEIAKGLWQTQYGDAR